MTDTGYIGSHHQQDATLTIPCPHYTVSLLASVLLSLPLSPCRPVSTPHTAAGTINPQSSDGHCNHGNSTVLYLTFVQLALNGEISL